MRSWIIRALAVAVILPMMPAALLANADIAKRFSDGAAISGTRVLIIGFEGLAGFNKSKADQIEYYQCRLTFGQKAGKPFGIGGGHVTSALMVDVVEKYKNKVKVAMYAHDSCTTGNCVGPENLATQWMANAETTESTKGRKVIIVGHSFGGDAAAVLGKKLSAKGVAVDSVITIDGRRRAVLGMGTVGPAAGGRWINFYQKTDAPLMGFFIQGAENHRLFAMPFVGHIMLPYNKKILPALMEQIGDPPGEATLQLTAHNEKNCENNTLASMGAYRGTPGAVEAVPIAAVVGGGGYLAYQALKKKGSSDDDGDSDNIRVADSLKDNGKKISGGGEGAKSLTNKASKNSGTVEAKIDDKPRTIEGLENLKKEETQEIRGASRLPSDERKKTTIAKQNTAAPTRFDSGSMEAAVGARESSNSVGGGTAALEGIKSTLAAAQDPSFYPSGGGGFSNREPASTEETEKNGEGAEDISETAESDLTPAAGGWHGEHDQGLHSSKEETEFSVRGSLFERVNRKLKQRMQLPVK